MRKQATCILAHILMAYSTIEGWLGYKFKLCSASVIGCFGIDAVVVVVG